VQLLELRDDPVGAVNVTAQQVLQRVEAVEAAAALADLYQPGPDIFRRGIDGDRAGGGHLRERDQLVARHGAGDLRRRRAPPVVPVPDDGGRKGDHGHLGAAPDPLQDLT